METPHTKEPKPDGTKPAGRKIYDHATKTRAGKKEVLARHILFRVNDPIDQAANKAAEDKVKNTIERIKKGEDFGTLAKALTEDPSGKQDGGDLGYFTRDQMVPAFYEVPFSLATDQVSGPAT